VQLLQKVALTGLGTFAFFKGELVCAVVWSPLLGIILLVHFLLEVFFLVKSQITLLLIGIILQYSIVGWYIYSTVRFE